MKSQLMTKCDYIKCKRTAHWVVETSYSSVCLCTTHIGLTIYQQQQRLSQYIKRVSMNEQMFRVQVVLSNKASYDYAIMAIDFRSAVEDVLHKLENGSSTTYFKVSQINLYGTTVELEKKA